MNKHEHIPGWGADLDRANRPGVPMARQPPRLEGVHWKQPTPQARTVEILTSIEYSKTPPVFGTSSPPRGLSGWLRRRAFGRSENDLRHWMILLLADRVDAVEGVLEDARKSPATLTLAAVAGVAVVATLLLRSRRP